MKAPMAPGMSRTATQPLTTPRTMRHQSMRGLSSLPAGKMVPIHAVPVLREDAVRSGRMRFSFEMMETAEVLMNAINVRVMAYFVPMLALDRFNGSMDQLNLSYEGKPPLEGETVVPYIEQAAFGAHGTNDIYRYLGLHGRADQMVNTAYVEAYNQIWNFRAKNRSPDLDLRTRLSSSLAPAFWLHERFKHMVPDFDQAIIDGEVPITFENNRIIVGGIGYGSQTATGTQYEVNQGAALGAHDARVLSAHPVAQGGGGVWAELASGGITMSLSNLELARKTQAFGELRRKYNMHDDHIINLLMDGISIPDQAFKQPMLVGDKRTVFGMSKRYASDSGNLTESVVNGATQIDLSVQLPRMGTGGVLMIVAEVTPDQLFERQEEPFLNALTVSDFPQYLRDTLDPEKVDIVKNSRIDTSHTTPNGTFAYEPLNARWNIDTPRVGGRFYRPTVNTSFDEDRQRIWSVETVNPTLSEDFYLCTNMHTKPFVVTNQDPFEVVTVGDVFLEGNTVFGGHLVEATDDYESILAIADQTRIEKE